MTRRRLARALTLAAGLALMITSALGTVSAGDLDPVLMHELTRAAPDDTVPAFVYLSDQVDLKQMTTWLDKMKASRQFRHERVIRALQEKARATQPVIQARLQQWQDEGLVKHHVSFWIFNRSHLVLAVREPYHVGDLRR
jgi:hypothetical protein